jgi:cytochrome c551
MSMKKSAFGILALLLVGALIMVVVGCATPAATGPAGSTTTTVSPAGGGPNTTASGAPALNTSSSNVAEGQSIYAANCVSCHGQNGQGGTAPSLTSHKDLDLVKLVVESGTKNSPAFKDKLSPAQITAVAQYVLSLAGK